MDLFKIVEQASTLSEKLSDRFIASIPAEATEDNEQLINSRLYRWCEVVGKGDRNKFAKRIAWDNLDDKTIIKALGKVRLADEKQLPPWAESLKQVLEFDRQKTLTSVPPYLDREDPIPFEEFYLPFVEVGTQKLIALVGDSWHLLSESVQISIERQLLTLLATLGLQCLVFEFSLFRDLKQATFFFSSDNSDFIYQTFVNNLKADQLGLFLQKYAVLARLLTTTMDFWVEEKAEFIQRLASDLPQIQQTFTQELGQVIAIDVNLGDRHNQGRSVMGLEFASGLKLIYKPRSLSLEVAYFKLLEWCNQKSDFLDFKILKLIDRSTYGWMKYVPHLPCEDESAAKRYYLRAGMLICLLYVLEGTDFHYENLIASGEQPVLVDLETIMHPHAQEIDPKMAELGAQYLAKQQFFDSVLRTGLLPKWEFGLQGEVYDITGLGGMDYEGIKFPVKRLHNINTDKMVLKNELETMPNRANTVYLNGTVLSANDYIKEILEGFQQMYQFLRSKRDELLAQDSPIQLLANQKTRFLFRNTQVYYDLIQKSIQPKFLKHGVDRSIEIEALSLAFLAADDKPTVWLLQQEELESVEKMEIPYFQANSNHDGLTLAKGITIDGYFLEAPYTRIISRLKQLSDADQNQQLAIISGSFYSRKASVMADIPASNISKDDLEAITPLTPTELVNQAKKIALELQQRAIKAPDGSVSWIGLAYLPTAGRLQLQCLDHNLYDGLCGVALFLAALAKITGEAEYRDLSLNALQSLKKHLPGKDSAAQIKIVKNIGIGGAVGIGAIVYSLVKISQFLTEVELIELANLCASFITEETISSDRKFDLIAGSAGAIVSLLSLYEVNNNPTVLDRAIACGHHLLNNRSLSDNGLRAWATLEDKLIAGFSHGAAGIAYALLRLYQVTQQEVFRQAAEEAIAYEDSLFSLSAKNWPDLRISKSAFPTNWCHGAPGVALGRLGALPILDTVQITQYLEIALQTTKKFGLQNIDHLCCGNFGRIEVLLVASQQLSELQLLENAQKQATLSINRAEKMGGFQLFSGLFQDMYNPGFFQGTTGIGYQLLRLAYPDIFPSILMWR